MIDMPGRKDQRFPNDKRYIDIAKDAIATKLDELGADENGLALCGGACGGDLLFAEACLERNIPLEIRIPFDEPTFFQNSVSFAEDTWIQRFYKVKANSMTRIYAMSDADEIGKAPEGINPYTRNNLWQLYTALGWGPQKVRFICLWDGKGGDGPGGTKDMYDQVMKHSGQVSVVDIYLLFNRGK
jgi:hypothetical protein